MSRKGFASSGRKDGFASSSSRDSFARPGFGAFSSATTLSYLAEPPDISSLDPNVAVSFKSLSMKKDDATKTRALTEIITYVKDHPFEELTGNPLLEAWVKLYPRTSIDNSGRVRELSHSLQYSLMVWGRKRMEKHVPKVVGPWLAGTFDRHRPVATSAKDGLSSFLTTEEKQLLFWKKCQSQILEYAIEAVQETVETLCDDRERAATPADARAKFLRVGGGALALVLKLFRMLDGKTRSPFDDRYEKFLTLEQIWELAGAEDSSLRKTLYQLLDISLDHKPSVVDSLQSRLRRKIVCDGLKCDQTNSATEYVRVLTRLTKKHPSVWAASGKKASDKKESKRSPIALLQAFLEKGSQGGSGSFWVSLDQLLSNVPQDEFSFEIASAFAHAMRTGVSNRLEPRPNAPEAWACYIELVRRFSERLASYKADSVKLIQECIFPLTSHYISQEPSIWATGGQVPVLLRAYKLAACHTSLEALREEWGRLSDDLIARVASSLPEQSEDHQKLQEFIADAGGRWFTLVGAIFHAQLDTSPVLEPSQRVLSKCVDLLDRRSFKPFGAASILQSAVRKCHTLFDAPRTEDLIDLVCDNMDRILPSQSSDYLFSCVNGLGSRPDQAARDQYIRGWTEMVAAVLQHSDQEHAPSAVAALVSNGDWTAKLARSNSDLQDFMVTSSLECARGERDCWKLLLAAFTFDSFTVESANRLAKGLVNGLTPGENTTDDTLRALEIIAQHRPQVLTADEDLHIGLVTKLLGMTNIAGERVTTIRTLIDQTTPASSKSPAVMIVQSNLCTATTQSLEVDTLVEQALAAFKSGTASLGDLLPDVPLWLEELLVFFQTPPNPLLCISSNLKGAQFLTSPALGKSPSSPSGHDRYGASVPARMALYTSKLLSEDLELASISMDQQVDTVRCLLATAQLASDQISLMDDNQLWKGLLSRSALSQAEELVTSVQKFVDRITDSAIDPWAAGTLLDKLVPVMLEETKALKLVNLYYARALAGVFEQFSSTNGLSHATTEKISKFDVFKANSQNVLGAASVLVGFSGLLSSSKQVSNFCNNMVSEMLGAKPEGEQTLLNLVLLNAVSSVYEIGTLPVANNRIVFAVKHITSWFSDPEDLDEEVATEACRVLSYLMPCMTSTYGTFWEDALSFITHLLERAEADPVEVRHPYIHAALRLESTLMSTSAPNDDLVDALRTSDKERSTAVLDLLGLPRGPECGCQVAAEVAICRRVSKIPPTYLTDLSPLYSLIASESRDIQTAVFTLLCKTLPAQQQQISVNVVLDKTEARLPEELTSLFQDPPTLEQYPEDLLVMFPIPIRSYLLAWLLVFSAYGPASHKVRDDYTAQLKQADFVTPLLDLLFDVLGHSASAPLRLERDGFDTSHIMGYEVGVADAEAEERNMQWCLLHIFYLVLTYAPGLFKHWHINCRRKATKIAVQSWTERYYSPLIINRALEDVAEWAKHQSDSAEGEEEGREQPLNIKVNKTAREVVAGYEIDDLEASIGIKLAADFPLGGVTVNGIRRVVVVERKWQSWMVIVQGVIMFSNGNIIDGLTVFRKNILGALKGHVECAICFSIISEDHKTPEKRCGTCKNMFHKYCLYKWLSASNQNTCPLCRNPID